MQLCTHCNSLQPDTHAYRAGESARAICPSCISNLVEILPLHIGAVPDLTPREPP